MKTMDMRPRARSALCLCLALLLFVQGCASHKVRTIDAPSPESSTRSAAPLGSIGVVAAAGTLEPGIAEPPAGWTKGFARGASAGAQVSVLGGLVVGFLSLMGGGSGGGCGSGCGLVLGWALGWTALGLAAAPVAAVVGGVVGAVKSQSPGQVERGKTALINAVSEARLPESIRDEIIHLSLERTGRVMVPLTRQGPEVDDHDVDTVLDILIGHIELEGRTAPGKLASAWSDMDPELNLRVRVDVRLIKTSNGEVLDSKSFEKSGAARKFSAWAADDGRVFRQGLEEASSYLANQIADYALRSPPAAVGTNEDEQKPDSESPK